MLVVLEEVSVRLVEFVDEAVKVFPVDVASSIVVVLLPDSDEGVNIQLLYGEGEGSSLRNKSINNNCNKQIKEYLAYYYLISNKVGFS